MNEKIKKICTYLLYSLLMYICVLIESGLYIIGVYASFLSTFIAVLLSYLAYKKSTSILDLFFLDTNLLLSVFLGGRYSTSLYYNNISSDDMSLMIGNIFTGIGLLIVGFFVLIFLIARIVSIILEKKEKTKG